VTTALVNSLNEQISSNMKFWTAERKVIYPLTQYRTLFIYKHYLKMFLGSLFEKLSTVA
jgi:hypothetical protein